MEMASVELYFRKMQFNGLKKRLYEAKEYHEEEIKTQNEAIAELAGQGELH